LTKEGNTMLGHIYKEIKRKAEKCITEEGKTEKECINSLEEEYDLEDEDKDEIKNIIHDIGKP